MEENTKSEIQQEAEKSTRSSFLLRNLFKGLLWMGAVIISFILIKDTDFIKDQDWLHSISENYFAVYLTFTLSEIIFGIIPPEVFMIWSIHHGITTSYWINIFFLAVISYGAGVIGYYVGLNFRHTSLFKKLYQKYLYKYENEFRKFSGFILFVGAVTPVPFSAMCMLVGTIKYPPKFFYSITLTRIMRFIIYGYLIYQANRI